MPYDAHRIYYRFDDHLSRLVLDYEASRHVDERSERLYNDIPSEPYGEDLFEQYNVKRGLRNNDGTGVVAGLTRISDIHGYKMVNGVPVPDRGRLLLRGYDLQDLVNNAQKENRFGYEEIAYLLITGELPTFDELADFRERLGVFRHLSGDFVQQFPITTVSPSIMNVLQRAVLLLYAFDAEPDSITPEHEVDVALSLLSRLPRIAAFAQTFRNAQVQGRRAPQPVPDPELSTAEAILQILRGENGYTHEEAMLLDVMLMIHAEHGGGNNSTFTCRVLSSSATDAYSAYAAAIGSLKGPRHGGANEKVVSMHEDIRAHVKNWENEDELASYLAKILRREAFDGSGLIYGMGHAVYTLSDPRAELCRSYAHSLAEEKGLGREFELIERIERISPEVMRDVRGTTKPICANIDLYSGFIYRMLGIPDTMFTPMFAVARTAGWAAHRMEELICAHRIIRPAYRSVLRTGEYVPIAERTGDIATSEEGALRRAVQ